MYDLQSALIDDDERDSLPKLRSRNLIMSSPVFTAQQKQVFSTPIQNISFDQSSQNLSYIPSPIPETEGGSFEIINRDEPPEKGNKMNSRKRRPFAISDQNKPIEKSGITTRKTRLTSDEVNQLEKSGRTTRKRRLFTISDEDNQLEKSDKTTRKRRQFAISDKDNQLEKPSEMKPIGEESVESRFHRIASKVLKRRDGFKNRKAKESLNSSQEIRQVPTRILQEIQQPTPNTSPIPLIKRSNTQKQKPLMVHIERITNDRDKRIKINTIDVLKSLVIDYEPKLYNSLKINEYTAQKDFKNHIMNHLDTLLDMFTSINDLTQSIKQIQKQKDEIRNKIFDINQQHNKVGQELNQLRLDYKQITEKNTKIQTINHGLQTLKINNKLNNNDNTQLSQLVNFKLLKLTKITNPEVGILHQLTSLNQKLNDIDQKLN